MHLYRYSDVSGQIRHALKNGDTWQAVDGSFTEGFTLSNRSVEPVHFHAPVSPPVIFGIGLNYHSYAAQLGKSRTEWPLVFMKQGACAIADGEPIQLPRHLPSDAVDYEGELAVVIGKTCKNASLENAWEFVAGFCCANDVSARDWQFEKGEGQFSRGKTFDTFCPLGASLRIQPGFNGWAAPAIDWGNMKLKTWVNGELRQHNPVDDLVFSIPEIIAFLSGSTTLYPGTVILTGTPSGTGSGFSPPRYLKHGDVVEIAIDGIGSLRNPVITEP